MATLPPPLPRPERPESTEEQLARESQQKQIRTSYGMVFESEHGKTVLSDLMANFGFDLDGIEAASAIPGLRSEEVWLREGCKQPIRHILKRLKASKAEKPTKKKPNTATQ